MTDNTVRWEGPYLGIEVKTDQQTIGHSPPRRQVPRKGKGAR